MLSRYFLTTFFLLFVISLYGIGNRIAPTFIYADKGDFISPNEDGVKDYIDFTFIVSIRLKSIDGYLPFFTAEVLDESDNQIRVFSYSEEADLRRAKQLFTPYREFFIARHFHFDGLDEFGNPLPDKNYKLKLTVSDTSKNSATCTIDNIILDTTQPEHQFLNINSNFKTTNQALFLSPSDRKNFKPIKIVQSGSKEKLWKAQIVNSNQVPIKVEEYIDSCPADFEWDGKDSENNLVAEGRYSFEVFCTDEAGNKTYRKLEPIIVNYSHQPVELKLSSPSLVIDSKKDFIQVSPICKNPDTIVQWKYSLTKEDKNSPVVELYSTSQIAQSIHLDSYAHIGGQIVPEGFYLFDLTLWYKNGDSACATKRLYFDTTPAKATVTAPTYNIISPKTKNAHNYFEFIQDGSVEELWQMEFFNQDNQLVFSKQIKKGKPTNFKWFGTDSQNRPLPDGIYSYKLTAFNPVNDIVFQTQLENLELLTYDVGLEASINEKLFSLNPKVKTTLPEVELSYKSSNYIVSINYSLVANGTNRSIYSHQVEPPQTDVEQTQANEEGLNWLPTKIEVPLLVSNGEALLDGKYKFRFQANYNNGASTTYEELLTIDSKSPNLSFKSGNALVRSTGKNSINSSFTTFACDDASPIESWELVIKDGNKKEIRNFKGKGNPARLISWNTSKESGNYTIELTATDKAGNHSTLASPTNNIDLIILDINKELHLGLPSIPFAAHQSNLNSVSQAQYNKSVQTLNQIKALLENFPNYNLLVRAHALNANKAGSVAYKEEEEALTPLTQRRAEAIKNYLVETLEISQKRISAKGVGSTMPLEEPQDFSKNYKNNRVDFILQPTRR